MRRNLALVLRVAAIPVGVGVGLSTAQLTPSQYQCPPKAACLMIMLHLVPTFATWQCILFGAGAAALLLLLSFNASRSASVVAGVGVGFWTAQLQSLQQCSNFAQCPSPDGLVLQPAFPAWLCVLFGAGVAAAMLILFVTVDRPPNVGQLKAA